METIKTFASIDFETMGHERISACSIGVVLIRDGVHFQEFYTLLKPASENAAEKNVKLHGITPDMVKNAPTFKEIYPVFRELTTGCPLVCHNASMDIAIIKQLIEFYDIDTAPIEYVDTYSLTQKKLADACAEHGIEIEAHHNALADARACAELLLKIQGEEIIKAIPGDSIFTTNGAFHSMDLKGHENIKGDVLKPLKSDEVENPDNDFFMKKVVITGKFERFPDRRELAKLLKPLGADIDTAITKRTQIVIVGRDAGYKKLEKIQSLKEDGYTIEIYDEARLIEALKHAKSI